MKRDRRSAENSYTYEATFAAGSIGINLQTTRSGFGTYVDSFHRAPDNSLLPAELSGYIKLGDVLREINGDDVSQMPLSDIPRVLGAAKRPVCMKLERAVMALTFADTVRDPRKLPWLMQYLVDSAGIEAAITDQAKIYMWLECDQYVHNYSILSERDSCTHAFQIVKKFFTEGSTFSLLEQVSDNIRHKMDAIVGASDALGAGPGSTSTPTNRLDRKNDKFLRLFRECQGWIEQDMNSVNFKKFISSPAASRMAGYLVYSPPFEKMTLFDILRCDRRTMYMLSFLSQIKRHTTLYCYNMLRDEAALEASVEGITADDIRDLTEKGFVCAHILGIDESSAGAEDLPMIDMLKGHISIADTASAFKGSPRPFLAVGDRGIVSPLGFEEQGPGGARVVSSMDTVSSIRVCLVALRNSMLRELVQDLSPKFFASKEFEMLLWELNEYREKAPSPTLGGRRYSVDLDDDDSVSSGSDIKASEAGGVVPNGAVQRLLRKMNMPDDMTMHRAPIELLEEIRNTRMSVGGGIIGPLCWLCSFDTDFSVLSPDDITKLSQKRIVGPKLSMSEPVPILASGGSDPTAQPGAVSVVPKSLEEFFVPSGKILWEPGCRDATFSNQSNSKTMPPTRLFNFTLSGGGDVGMLYVAAVVCNRPLALSEQRKWTATVDKLAALACLPSPLTTGGRTHEQSPKPDTPLQRTPGPLSSVPSPATTLKGSVSDENLALKIGSSPATIGKATLVNGTSPKDANGNSTLNQLKGKVDKLTSSPFFDKFKGIASPAMFRSYQPVSTPLVTQPPVSVENAAGVEDGNSQEPKPISPTSSAAEPDAENPTLNNKGSKGDSVPPVSLKNHYEDAAAAVVAPAEVVQTCESLVVQKVEDFEDPVSPVCKENGIAVGDAFVDISCGDLVSSTAEVETPTVFPDRFAANGFCVVTKYPAIDALRLPVHDILRSAVERTTTTPAQNDSDPDLVVVPPLSELVEIGEKVRAFEALRRCVAQADQRDPAVLRSGGATDFDPNPILRNINPKNLVALFFALMLEQKIAVISSKLTALTCLGEFLREALVPFHWNHVYVPVLPKKMSSQILECPTPFFVGIQRDFFDAKAVPSDVCVLDLDHDACRMSPELTKALKAGRRIIRGLDLILRPQYVSCDNLVPKAFPCAKYSETQVYNNNTGPPEVAAKVMSLLRAFSWEVLLGIHECGMSSVDHDEVVVLFDEAMFLSFKRRRATCSLLPADDSFLKPLLRTQAFSVAATTVVLKRLDAGSRPGSRGPSPFITARTRSTSGGGSYPQQEILSPQLSQAL